VASARAVADPSKRISDVNRLQHLRDDLPASVVVLFVAVPLCMGIALASGAPLFSGLIAGIIGGIVVGSLSGSSLGVSGPAAGLAVIVLDAIGRLGFEAFLLAVVLSGGIQMLLGAARAGVLAYFFPSAVIRGMLAGIGLIIFLKQIPHAVGYDKDPEGELQFIQPDGETTFSELTHVFDAFRPSAIIVAVCGLAILILWERVLSKRSRIFQLIQGPLVAVAFGILYQVLTMRFWPSMALGSSHLVNVPVVEGLDSLKELLRTPEWSRITDPAIWLSGATIAIVGSLETLLCLEATDKMDPQKRVTPTNRELVAQGVGNSLSGVIGGLPITQVIVRSSANIQSGAKTKVSAIMHGVLLLVFVLTLPKLLNLVPLATLASILLVVGFKLARPALWRQMWWLGWEQFVPFAVTIAGILFTDLLQGIAYGLAASLLIILRRNYLNSHFLHIEERDEDGRRSVRLKLSEEVTFLNKGAILRELSGIPDGTRVTIDMTESLAIDHDVLEVIGDFHGSAAERGIEVVIVPESEKPTVLAAS